MKYSLRSLMIGITLICVLLRSVMGRVEYLRQWAVYHEREANLYSEGQDDDTRRGFAYFRPQIETAKGLEKVKDSKTQHIVFFRHCARRRISPRHVPPLGHR